MTIELALEDFRRHVIGLARILERTFDVTLKVDIQVVRKAS